MQRQRAFMWVLGLLIAATALLASVNTFRTSITADDLCRNQTTQNANIRNFVWRSVTNNIHAQRVNLIRDGLYRTPAQIQRFEGRAATTSITSFQLTRAQFAPPFC